LCKRGRVSEKEFLFMCKLGRVPEFAELSQKKINFLAFTLAKKNFRKTLGKLSENSRKKNRKKKTLQV
jgi:hypothetical protein